MNISVHPVVQVQHTVPYQPPNSDIQKAIPTRPDPVTVVEGNFLSEVEQILGHRKRGSGFKWLKLMKDSPQNDAQLNGRIPTNLSILMGQQPPFFWATSKKRDFSGIFGE